jgi:hypothetical protein
MKPAFSSLLLWLNTEVKSKEKKNSKKHFLCLIYSPLAPSLALSFFSVSSIVGKSTIGIRSGVGWKKATNGSFVPQRGRRTFLFFLFSISLNSFLLRHRRTIKSNKTKHKKEISLRVESA